MPPALKILFYDDAVEFGGHESMTMAAVQHAVTQPNVEAAFMFFHGNVRLSRQVAELAARHPALKQFPQAYASGRFQAFRTLVSGRAIRRIAASMAAYAPDLVVLAQGAIAFGSAGLLAAKRAGLYTVSYIPMTHPERLFSESRLKAALREPVNRIYYRLPDEYITISRRMEEYLRRKGLRQPVTVVPAAIDPKARPATNKDTTRADLGLGASDQVFALIGRVQFWQKRQDLAVKALALARRNVANLKLLVVGDGPDLAALKALARAEGVEDAVVFTGWRDDLPAVYSAIDVLVIPSRYEGVPLVMLDAMHFGRPVLASAVDGMADTLPPHWLFPSGDATALASRMAEMAGAHEPALLEAHKQLVLDSFSMPAFETAFMATLRLAASRRRVMPGARAPRSAAIIEPVGGHGGMNYYDFGLCRGLVAAGVRPTLYTCDATQAVPGLPFEVKLEYRGVFGRDPAWRRGLRYLSGSLRALVGARIGGSRLAHFHVFQVGALELFNVVLAKALLMRVVVTAHDVEAFRGEWSSLKGWVYGLADRVIAHNLVSRRELVQVLGIPERKIHVIPHGNYLGDIGRMPPTEDARAKLGLPPTAPVLLFFGQIKEVKGLDLLLDALAAIKGAVPDVVLVIAGKTWGQDFARYQSQIDSLGLRSHCITQIRYIADDEVATYYAAADLVVLPYRRIYQSGVVLMAMSYGKPVLASDLQGMTEVIEDGVNGYVFRTGDTAHLAERLLSVLADRAAMQRAAVNGLGLMRDTYGWERIGRLTAECYGAAFHGVDDKRVVQ